MDGMMVAYHNTERIFGFQYISLDEMDDRLFGPVPGIGNKIFNHCVEILEAVLVEATSCFPDQVSRWNLKSLSHWDLFVGQSVLCAFETRVPGKVMEVYVRPMKWEGTEEERPIQQLLVTLEHKVNGIPARVAQALRTTNEKCTSVFHVYLFFLFERSTGTVEYQIMRSALGPEDLKADLRMVEKRKNRQHVLPSDMPLESAEEYWKSLNYNTARQLVPDGEDAKIFRSADLSSLSSLMMRWSGSVRCRGRVVKFQRKWRRQPACTSLKSCGPGSTVVALTPCSAQHHRITKCQLIAIGEYLRREAVRPRERR